MAVDPTAKDPVAKDVDPTTDNYDAQQLAEEIATGEEQAPKVNVDDDYERSKQFDVAEVDRTGADSQAVESQQSADASQSATQSATGDPEEFRKMAREVKPSEE